MTNSRWSDSSGPRRYPCHRSVAAILAVAVLSPQVVADTAPAGTALTAAAISEHRSRHFQLHTDLTATEADALLGRMEATLRIISKYWQRPLKRQVVCFVIDDLSNWPDDKLPYPQAKNLLRHVKGGTRIMPSSKGKLAHVYATKQQGIAEHELVHAYCQLTFGTCGPDWYKEGMAEMASHYSRKDRGIHCPREVVRFLRSDQPKSINEVVRAGEFTGPIAVRFSQFDDNQSDDGEGSNPWLSADDRTVRKARESYHRSWLLCHFLCNNANYRDRFRLLGMSYLRHGGADFDKTFQPVRDQLAFEYGQFVRNFDNGYRVDLCHWNWQKKFAAIEAGDTETVSIKAAHGFQPSGLLVSAGQGYTYAASGRWHTGGSCRETNADGDALGQGRLEAAILHGYSLGEPFHLSESGSFVARRSGKLYLRCRDKWNELADNQGRVAVRLETKEL